MPSRRSIAVIVALLGLAAIVAAEYPKSVKKDLYADDVRGKAAPAFAVEQWLTPEPQRPGKVLLIDFWATWCPPCRETIPELNQLQKEFNDDLLVIGISDEPAKTVTDFMKGTKMEYSLAIDTRKRMSDAIHVKGIPHVLVISTDGVVRWQGFPLSTEEPLTDKIVKQIIDADPGIAAKRAKAGS